MKCTQNHNDETVPINPEQRKKQEGVADATKVKERKKYLENTANGVALQLSASKDPQAQKETQNKLAKQKLSMTGYQAWKPMPKQSTPLKPPLKKKAKNIVERVTR